MAESEIVLPLAIRSIVMTDSNSPPAFDPELRAKLDKLGITVVPRAEYHWGAFRYSTATDAIAAAERSAR